MSRIYAITADNAVQLVEAASERVEGAFASCRGISAGGGGLALATFGRGLEQAARCASAFSLREPRGRGSADLARLAW